MAEHPAAFSKVFCALVRAGELTDAIEAVAGAPKLTSSSAAFYCTPCRTASIASVTTACWRAA